VAEAELREGGEPPVAGGPGGKLAAGGARGFLRRHLRALLPSGALLLGGLLACLAGGLLLTPNPLAVSRWSTVILDRRGEILGASIAVDGQWRFPPAGPVNGRYATALVEFEDRRFRLHPGVDPLAILRAARQWIERGRVVSGASTISMQAVRLLRAGQEKDAGSEAARRAPARGALGLGGKALEALLALRLERSFPKDSIMRIYASSAPYGGNVVGLEAAAWRWFGRRATDLTWAEAATLAVLPNNPALVNPGSRRTELLAKRDSLLRRLAAAGKMDDRTLELALAETLPPEPFALPRFAPQLLDRVMEGGAGEGAGSRGAGTGAALVRTSLDRSLQIQVSAIVDRAVARYAGNGIRNAACVVLDLKSGEALAYVGNSAASESRASSPWVDLAQARRSSGSLLKPFLYAARLEAGEILPESLILDLPTRIGGYLPENNSRSFMGAVPAAEALARSLNIPAVRELRSFGVDRFASLLRGLGVTTLFRDAADYGLPLILGGAEVTLWEITGLYAGLGRTALSRPGPERERAFAPPTWLIGGGGARAGGNPYSAASAWLTLEALLEVARPGEEASWQEYASGRRIAWKTGTSFGFRDAWSVGLTPGYAVGVWVGNASGEGRPELRGIVNAAPLLFEVFSSMPTSSWFPEPASELVGVTTCARSGFLAGPYCAETKEILAPRAGRAAQPCPWCRPVTLDLAGDHLASVPGTPLAETRTENRFVLPPAVEWYYRKQHFEYRPLPPPAPGTALGTRPFDIIQPTEGAALYAPLELSGEEGRLVFEAAAGDPAAELFWHLDEDYLGTTRNIHRLECRPGIGRHVLTLVDANGASQSVRFVVLSR